MMKLKREAEIFGKYIIKENINETAISRYIQGVHKLKYNQEDKHINKILKWPVLLPYVDAGFALTNKKHLLQKKLLLMFSILETMPEYSSKFLAKPQPFFYIFYIIFTGAKGILKTVFGIIINKLL